MKKILIFICLTTCFLTSHIFAIPKGPCDEPQDVCCEEAVGPYAFSYPQDHGLACERGFNVHGEFLLMKTSEEGLDYAMSNIDSATTWVFPVEIGKVEGFSSGSQEWDWRPGFRVGFGSNNTFDQYQISINWTYIRIKGTAQANKLTGDGDFLPLFLPPINVVNTFSLQDASAKWSGDFSTLDITLGKPYHVSRYLAGFNTQFIASKNWSIYTKTIVSLLFGKFDLSQHASWTDLETSPSASAYNVEDSFYSVQPNAELGAGLAWSNFFDDGQYLVSIKVGYEFIQFWDQNQLRRFFDLDPAANDTVSRGDLSFNGFQFAINIDF